MDNPSGLPWKSSGYRGDDIAKTRSFGTFRGRKIDHVSLFIGLRAAEGGWDGIKNVSDLRPGGSLAAVYDTDDLCATLATPLFPTSEAMRFDRVKSGEFDLDYRDIGRTIKKRIGADPHEPNHRPGDTRPIYLRLGWEASRYGHYHWGIITDEPEHKIVDRPGFQLGRHHEDYAEALCRAANILKEAIGPRCKTIWNVLKNFSYDGPDSGDPATIPRRGTIGHATYYPGHFDPRAFDFVGMDAYDTKGTGGTKARWAGGFGGRYVPSTGEMDGPLGLFAFTRALRADGHPHVKCTFEEWGASNRALSREAPGNNDYYIKRMFNEFWKNRDILELECYQNDSKTGKHEIQFEPSRTEHHNSMHRAAYLEVYDRSYEPDPDF